MENSRILLLSQRRSDLVEMKRAAKSFSGKGFQCFMLYVRADITESIEDDLISCMNNKIISGYHILDSWKKSQYKAVRQEKHVTAVGRMRLCVDKVKSILKKIMLIRFCYDNIFLKLLICILSIARIPFIVITYKRNYEAFFTLIKEYSINLIVLPEDVVGSVCPLLIRAGHQCKVPSMILPYTICDQNEAFQSLKNNPNYSLSLLMNRFIGFIFPKWVKKKNMHAVIRMPAGHVLGQHITKTAPPDPWMMNSGYVNIIAVESKKMFDYYHNAGIPSEKMKITGAFYDDQLQNYLQEESKIALYDELGLSRDRPILLLGGCPNQLSATVPNFDFSDYASMAEFIISKLDILSSDYHFVFRPHPNFLELYDFFDNSQFKLSMLPTDRLIAASDIYVSFASATIRWAIACAVPVINYDVFHYDYDDYKGVSGVLHVNSEDEFVAAIDEIRHRDSLVEFKKDLAKVASYWGNMDGMSSSRIHQLADELLQLENVPRTVQ